MKKLLHARKASRLLQVISWIWLLLLVFAISILANLYVLFSYISQERHTQDDEIEMVKLGHKLANASDYLTTQARAFAVTFNIENLKNYWNEVNIEKNREHAVEQLKQLSAKPEEINLLIQSKRLSDQLIETEIRSMRLILEAHEVPEAIMPQEIKQYTLSIGDDKLSPSEKVLFAQDLVFNDDYKKSKKAIMAPIREFVNLLDGRIKKELENSTEKTNLALQTLSILVILISLLIISIIWTRFLFFTSTDFYKPRERTSEENAKILRS